MRAVHQAPGNLDTVDHATQILGVFKIVQIYIDRHGRGGTSQTYAPAGSRTLQSGSDSDTRPGHVETRTRPQILIVEVEDIHLHVIELGRSARGIADTNRVHYQPVMRHAGDRDSDDGNQQMIDQVTADARQIDDRFITPGAKAARISRGRMSIGRMRLQL